MGEPPALPVSVFGFTSSSVQDVIVEERDTTKRRKRIFFILVTLK